MGNRLGIVAPSGRDAAVLQQILEGAAIESAPFTDIPSVLEAVVDGRIGAVIIAEEGLTHDNTLALEAWLASQPPWSDLPIILMTTRRGTAQAQSRLAEKLGNVTILERPLHPVTLAFAARAALRARVRQHRAETYITELHRERSALAASEARYRTLFETIDEGFCVIAFTDGPHGALSDYIHIDANPAYTRHAGIPDIVGKRLREIVSESEASAWASIYREVLVTGRPVRFERELKETGRYLDLAAFRVAGFEERQVAVLFQDVTARKRAEKALRELNETLESRISEAVAERRLLADVIDHTSLFVQIVGNDWRLLAINMASEMAFHRNFGVRPQVGDDIRKLLQNCPEQSAALEEVWSRAFKGEEFTVVKELSNEGRSYEMHFFPLRDPDGHQIGAYQFVSDVTERIAEQRKLVELQKTDAIGQLTGGVAHDFNNLLAAIISNLDLARKHISDARIGRLIDGAMKGAERGASLTKRLLAFARRQELKAETVGFGRLISDIHELLDRSLGPGIKLEPSLPPDLPSITVDRNQLELAILNLAVNARDAMTNGGTLAITAEAVAIPDASAPVDLKPGRYVRINVIDEGSGMDDATIARATEPFFTTKGVGKGTGLGLSMVQGLAQQSNGAFAIDSIVGVGTTVSLWLPVAAVAAEIVVSHDANQELPTSTNSLNILVVDDDALVGMGTAAMLEDLGHVPIEASSARAALELLSPDAKIDLVITDQSMPGMTGLQLASEINVRRPGLPIILASGYTDLPDGQTTSLPRLAKPFRQEELAAIIESVVLSVEEGKTANIKIPSSTAIR